jgi:tetratricopeptide (TPR) repeat protein
MLPLRILLLFGLCAMLAFSAGAQELPSTKEAQALVARGQEALLQQQHERALKFFEKALILRPGMLSARIGQAGSLELLHRHQQAAILYDQILEDAPWHDRALYFAAGRAHLYSGAYGKALRRFQQYQTLASRSPEEFAEAGKSGADKELEYLEQLPRFIRQCHTALDSIGFLGIAEVQNLGAPVNSPADEYFPYLSNDQRVLYFTSRQHALADENMFQSLRERHGWSAPKPLQSLNTPSHEGMPSLVRSGRRLFFTACLRQGLEGPCDIWEADIEGRKVSQPRSVEGDINSMFWDSQASISCDGNTLFFASNRPGGFGGSDIWVSHRQSNGHWGSPENLGPRINTAGDEEAPFITNDGRMLYFSSTGHAGLGDQDIFCSRLQPDGQWGAPLNLGAPVNSAARELGFFLAADGRTGYFASDRSGGQGGMDIYRFQLPEQLYALPITLVEGQVLDSLSGKPLQVAVFAAGGKAFRTDKEGRFFSCLPAGERFTFTIFEDEYQLYHQSLLIPEWNNEVLFSLPVLLQPKHLPEERGPSAALQPPGSVLRNTVYFDLDKDELSPRAKSALEALVQQLKTHEGSSEIEIVGFTDERGSDQYNLQLSERRARRVAVYLKEQGIWVDRVYLQNHGAIRDANIPDHEKRKVEILVRLQ